MEPGRSTTSNTQCTHWCYTCRQLITLSTRNKVCSECNGAFIQELQDILNTEHQNTTSSITQTDNNNNNIMWGPWPIYSGDMPVRLPENGGLFDLFNEVLGFQRENGADFFVGPGVEEFFEQLTSREQETPPPTSKPLVDTLPTVRISKKEMRSDSHCAVCKEKFVLGSSVKKLACKHLYHSGCIEPWLAQVRSCPVCRSEVAPNGSGRRSGGKRRWSFLWPFGS